LFFLRIRKFTMAKALSPAPARKPRETSLRGRDARTGLFKTVEEARRDKGGSVVERIPLPGKGLK
jgi:hypothetical protein